MQAARDLYGSSRYGSGFVQGARLPIGNFLPRQPVLLNPTRNSLPRVSTANVWADQIGRVPTPIPASTGSRIIDDGNMRYIQPIARSVLPDTTNVAPSAPNPTAPGGTNPPPSLADQLAAMIAGGNGPPATSTQGIYVPPTTGGSSSATANPLLIVVVVAVLAVIGYFVYKHVKKGKAAA